MSMSLRLIDSEDSHFTPRIATLKSAAADLRAAIIEPWDIGKMQGAQIPTGVTVKFSEGVCGLLLPRSGLSAAPHYLTITNAPGLIDEDFEGEIFVNLFCLGSKITISPGDRIAQIIAVSREKITGHVDFRKDTRGTGGSGSTGVT